MHNHKLRPQDSLTGAFLISFNKFIYSATVRPLLSGMVFGCGLFVRSTMAILSLQSITADGVEPSYAAVTSQDVISGGGSDRVFLSVVNDGGSSVTVSVDAVRTSVSVPGVGQMIVPDMSVDVPAGESRMIGPFRDAYVSSAGEITLDFSGTSSVTAAALILERGV